MKKVSEYTYCENETTKTVTMYHLSNAGVEYYSNIDFLYNCKCNPSGYECDKFWLLENFNCETIGEAIETVHTKEYQFLTDNGFEDWSKEFGRCYRYNCTFVNDEIVVVEESITLDC